MIRRPPRSTLDRSSAASDVYKRQGEIAGIAEPVAVVAIAVLDRPHRGHLADRCQHRITADRAGSSDPGAGGQPIQITREVSGRTLNHASTACDSPSLGSTW